MSKDKAGSSPSASAPACPAPPRSSGADCWTAGAASLLEGDGPTHENSLTATLTATARARRVIAVRMARFRRRSISSISSAVSGFALHRLSCFIFTISTA